MTKTLTGKNIERIVNESKEHWDWASHLDWLTTPPYPFQRPIIYDNGTVIWGFCSIHPNAKIGANVVIGAFTNICGPAEIGDESRLQGFTFIPQGVTIGKRVFIGPGVMFTNIKYPTARFGKASRDRIFETILVEDKAAIGAGAVICPNVKIGKGALVAAGSIVTQDVMAEYLVKGNPARHIKRIVDLEDEEEQQKHWGFAIRE